LAQLFSRNHSVTNHQKSKNGNEKSEEKNKDSKYYDLDEEIPPPKKTNIFKADGGEKNFDELTISELGSLNPKMALEEQSFRYTRLKKEAKELRAGLRLKNITIDKLQQTI
jgi:hypothetical protein